MHNSAEKRFIITITTIIVSLIAVALVVFLVKYTNSSLYPKSTEQYVKVVYMDSDNEYNTELIGYNDELPLPWLERSGYSFRGWFYDENGEIKAKTGETVSSDTKLYAFWDIIRYSVMVHPNFDNQPAYYIELQYNDAFSVYPPARVGYNFDNWYYDEACTQMVYLTTMPAENIIVYAKWAKSKYTLKLLPGEGMDAIADAQVFYNDILELPVLEKEGYTFTGWYKERALINEVTNGSQMPSSSLTLYAGWAANNYNINFVTNGGSVIDPLSVAYQQDISAIELPETTRAGYDFEYWYTNIDDDSTVYVPNKMPFGGMTLYAKWRPRTDTQYKIEYYFENEEGHFVLNEDETETLQGTTEDYRSITNKSYIGYSFDAANILNYTEGYILGDGSTVFRFYYKLI